MTANPRQPLSQDHAELDVLFTDIIEAAARGVDPHTLSELWGAFERGVLAHFDAEERYLFPRVAAAHRAEVEALARAHDQIRALLTGFDVTVDLDFLRGGRVSQLIARLRAHGEREERTLYRWAEALAEPVPRALPCEEPAGR